MLTYHRSTNEELACPESYSSLHEFENHIQQKGSWKTQVPETFDKKAEQKALTTYVYLVHHTPLEFYNLINQLYLRRLVASNYAKIFFPVLKSDINSEWHICMLTGNPLLSKVKKGD